MRLQPYISVSGAASNSNKTDGFFDVTASQYTAYYKNRRAVSTLPVRAFFDSNKYKSKKPVPSDNTYVSVEGFLGDVEMDESGRATLFRMSVDNISFLGRAVLSASSSGSQGVYHLTIFFMTNL
jgi:hypothetical protein